MGAACQQRRGLRATPGCCRQCLIQQLGYETVVATGAVVGGDLHLPPERCKLLFAEQEILAGGTDQNGTRKWRKLRRGVHQWRHADPAAYQDHLTRCGSDQVETIPQRPEQLQMRAFGQARQSTRTRADGTRQEYTSVIVCCQETERPRQEHPLARNSDLCELTRMCTASDLTRSDGDYIVLRRDHSIRQNATTL